MISTDKAVNPTNIMGAPAGGEAYCQALDVSTEAIRYKTSASAMCWVERLGRTALRGTDRQRRTADRHASAGGALLHDHPRGRAARPARVGACPEAAEGARQDHGLDMGEPVRIVHLAERMIQLAGLKPYVDIDIVFHRLAARRKAVSKSFSTRPRSRAM